MWLSIISGQIKVSEREVNQQKLYFSTGKYQYAKLET